VIEFVAGGILKCHWVT